MKRLTAVLLIIVSILGCATLNTSAPDMTSPHMSPNGYGYQGDIDPVEFTDIKQWKAIYGEIWSAVLSEVFLIPVKPHPHFNMAAVLIWQQRYVKAYALFFHDGRIEIYSKNDLTNIFVRKTDTWTKEELSEFRLKRKKAFDAVKKYPEALENKKGGI